MHVDGECMCVSYASLDPIGAAPMIKLRCSGLGALSVHIARSGPALLSVLQIRRPHHRVRLGLGLGL